MEHYIKKVVMSIINQTFQNFEIIIVNDYSNDKTKKIVEKLQRNDNRIKIVNHYKNIGVYASRVDGIHNSKGYFLILMDPDDMFLNPNLFEKLYTLYLKYNLDMIEYTIFHYEEKRKHLYIDKNKNHFHHFKKNIIHQPELSSILFYNPEDKNYTPIICRSIWSKMIRKEILLKTINFIGTDYYNKFFVTAEDTLINAINFQFSRNYSNIDFPGYMYNIRGSSITHGRNTKEKIILFDYNYLLYIKKLIKVINYFKLNKNLLFCELKAINSLFVELRKLNKSKEKEIIDFYQEIYEDKNISYDFKQYITNLLNNSYF
jgi:glycosyltransferase involved in cell wall biosynthesis